MTMSINKEIVTVIGSLKYPVSFLNYEGKESNYFVFNFDDERGTHYGDDTPEYEVYSMQLHFFCTKEFNYTKLKEQVKQLLFKNGWTYPTTYQLYEDDYNHIVFTTEKESLIKWQK